MGEQFRNEIKATHLGFIESVIMRMGQNSLQTKSWCIALTVALITFYATCDKKPDYCNFLKALLTIDILFFITDVYYLRLEKGYRQLYEVVAGFESCGSITIKDYCMRLPKEFKGLRMIWKAIKSPSACVFYILLLSCQYVVLTLLCR